jgi:hypothetical protein
MRTVQNLSAGFAYPRRRRVDVADIEVIEPMRPYRSVHTVHHATHCLAAYGKDLIDAEPSAYVELMVLGPSEQAGIEGEGRYAIARAQLMPAGKTQRTRRDLRSFLIAEMAKQREMGALRIADHGEAADSGESAGGRWSE